MASVLSLPSRSAQNNAAVSKPLCASVMPREVWCCALASFCWLVQMSACARRSRNWRLGVRQCSAGRRVGATARDSRLLSGCDAPRGHIADVHDGENLRDHRAGRRGAERQWPAVYHWTQAALASASVERGIVASISDGSVERFLRELELKLHRTRGRINTRGTPTSRPSAPMSSRLTLAPGRAAPTQPMRPGQLERS